MNIEMNVWETISTNLMNGFDGIIKSWVGVMLFTVLAVVILAQLASNLIAGGMVFKRSSLWFTVGVFTFFAIVRYVIFPLIAAPGLILGMAICALLVLLTLLFKRIIMDDVPEEESDEKADGK